MAITLPTRRQTPGQVIANLYAAVNELVEAFTLDHAQMQAAEPFAPDFWAPGHSYRENLARSWVACRSQTRRAQTRRGGADSHFRCSCQRQRLWLTMERWPGHCRECVPLMHQERRR
jgi:hypothetical protein